MVTHSEILKQVAKLLRENDFYVRTQRSIPLEAREGLKVLYAITRKKPQWAVIVDVLGMKMKKGLPDLYPLVQGTDDKRLDIFHGAIAVEVSMSSDVKREIDKLRKLPVNLRLVVTADSRMRGELAGIPIVPYQKLNSKIIRNLKETFFCSWEDCDYFTKNREHFLKHEQKHGKHSCYE